MNSTLFPPDHSLSMKKVGISVSKPDPFFSGFLIPENLFLLENLPILSLQRLLLLHHVRSYTNIKLSLDTPQFAFNPSFAPENIAKHVSIKVSREKRNSPQFG